MSKKEDLEVRFLQACERGELQTILELVHSKAVDPNTVVEKRSGHSVKIGSYWFSTNGWTPLRYSCA